MTTQYGVGVERVGRLYEFNEHHYIVSTHGIGSFTSKRTLWNIDYCNPKSLIIIHMNQRISSS